MKSLLKQDLWARLSLLVLPLCFLAAAFMGRAAGGPYWLWVNLDPDYFYLLDGLNILNLTTPGHVYHPGTTVTWLAALILKASHLLTGTEEIIAQVLGDPEPALRLIGTVFVLINACAVLVLGAVGYRVFGDLLAAWFLQMAPFISMLVLKSSYHVKPESLLLFTALMLSALSILALKPGLLERRSNRFIIAFGVIAGFGVATKITVLPVFILPLFVLAPSEYKRGGIGSGVRAISLYGVAALAALFIFTLPAIGAYDVFFAWMAKVSQGTGAYGGGAAGFVDWAVYPKHILKLFKRPAFLVVFILSAVTLAAAWARRRRGHPIPELEVRLLLGIWVSQLAHVLMVAKQPNVLYMIPSYVLSPLAFVLVWWLGSDLVMGSFFRFLRPGVAALLAALVISQTFAVSKLVREDDEKSASALSPGYGRFSQCARIYAYPASAQSFALALGDFITGSRFSARLSATAPANDFWLEHWWDQSRVVFRSWRGPENLDAVLARYPCAIFRGGHWWVTEPLLKKIAPEIKFDENCSTRFETILTQGVGCDGKIR